MKKITSLIAAIVVAMSAMAQISMTRIWERSDSAFTFSNLAINQKPTYFDANTRGIAVGTINSNSGAIERMFLTSRHSEGNVIRVINVETGADVKSLNMTDVTGGGFVISDAGMTEDGVLLVSNCTHSSSGPFKIYKWNNEDSAPTVAISYPSGATRYGDKITVSGKYSDGSAKVYIIGGGALTNYKVQYFEMEQVNNVWQFKQTPTELATSITNASSNFHQFTPGPDGTFYFRSVGLNNFTQYNADGTLKSGSSHPVAVAQGTTTPIFIKTLGGYDYACYLRYGSAAFSKQAYNQIEVIKIDRSVGTSSATVFATSSSLGKTAPGNGAGNVVVKNVPNGDVDIFVLSSVNGFARYRLANSDFSTNMASVSDLNVNLTIAGNKLSIEGIAPSSIELFNTLGQKVRSISNTNEMRTDNLQGVYIVQVKAEGKIVKTSKVSIRQ